MSDLLFIENDISFQLFIRKIELEGGRVVAKESHSFIWWIAIVNPGKEV